MKKQKSKKKSKRKTSKVENNKNEEWQQRRLSGMEEYSAASKSSVVVSFLSARDERVLWYHIKPFEDDKSRMESRVNPRLHPNYSSSLSSWGGYDWAASGSKVYSFGGADFDKWECKYICKDYLLVYDTSSSSSEWLPSQMRRPRSDPVAVAVDDNIYVFGSNARGISVPKPWAEVFNTKSNEWHELREPPEYFVDAQVITGTAVYGDQILMEVGRRIYSYSITDDDYDDITSFHPQFLRIRRASVVMDNVLYTYDCGAILAYHLKDKKHCEVDGIDEHIVSMCN